MVSPNWLYRNFNQFVLLGVDEEDDEDDGEFKLDYLARDDIDVSLLESAWIDVFKPIDFVRKKTMKMTSILATKVKVTTMILMRMRKKKKFQVDNQPEERRGSLLRMRKKELEIIRWQSLGSAPQVP